MPDDPKPAAPTPTPPPAKPTPPAAPEPKPKPASNPIVAVPAVLAAIEKAKKDWPDADPDKIDDIAREALSGRTLATAGDVDAWCWEFLARVDKTVGPKKG